MLSPITKHMQVDQEETKTAAWIKRQVTKASDWLEYMSLKESIIWKAWAGWEEGMRLAHRQWEIGKEAARMQTTGEQLTLMLKLGEGENEQYRTWRRHYMGQLGDVEGECMDEGVIGLDA